MKLLQSDGETPVTQQYNRSDKTMCKKQKRCIFCNELMENSPKRVMYHKMCIIDSIYDTVYADKPLSRIHYNGAYAYNINISEIRKCVDEDKNGRI